MGFKEDPRELKNKDKAIRYWGIWDDLCFCIRGVINNHDGTVAGVWMARKKIH